MKPTDASYTLRDPHEVLTFLTKLVEWGNTEANAWHQKESCIGWALNTAPITPCLQNGTRLHAPQANGDGAPYIPNSHIGRGRPWSSRCILWAFGIRCRMLNRDKGARHCRRLCIAMY